MFLLNYRSTPHSTTGVSPAELMFGRKLRTVFDLAHPGKLVQKTVLTKQNNQKSNYDSKVARNLELLPESPVMVRNYSTFSKDRWVPARVLEQTGPVSYKCELLGGQVVRRHQDQILNRSVPTHSTIPFENMKQIDDGLSAPSPSVLERVDVPDREVEVDVLPKVATPVRRSARVVKPPDRLDL